MVCFTKSWGSLLTLAVVLFSTAIEAVPAPGGGPNGPRPPGPPAKKCKKPLIRKSWHSLTNSQRLKYINAVKCTQTKKGINKNEPELQAQFTIYEDFMFEHRKQTPYVHLVGHFLAWHRYYLKEFENTLRTKCNYDGAQPYWDYALDHHNFENSPIWHPVHGFGGNGITLGPNDPNPIPPGTPGHEIVSGGGCITTGPFKDYTIRLPRFNNPNPEPRCIERAWNVPVFEAWFDRARENQLYTETTFVDFYARHLDRLPSLGGPPPNPNSPEENGGMHLASHLSVGGTAADGFMSPGDPLFFMLHTNLDRIWRKWQSQDPIARHNAYGGTDIPPPGVVPMPAVDPWGYFVRGVNITASYPLSLEPIAGEITVEDVQDTTGGFLCYDYDTTYVQQ